MHTNLYKSNNLVTLSNTYIIMQYAEQDTAYLAVQSAHCNVPFSCPHSFVWWSFTCFERPPLLATVSSRTKFAGRPLRCRSVSCCRCYTGSHVDELTRAKRCRIWTQQGGFSRQTSIRDLAVTQCS